MKYYNLEEVRQIRDKISKLGDLRAETDKLRIETDKLRIEGYKLRAEDCKLLAKSSKLWAEGSKLRIESNKLKAEDDIKLFNILIRICADGYYKDWKGYLAIPKDNNEEWIIPVFDGECEGTKHNKYSIWTLPRNSCDKKDAKCIEESER